MYFRPLSTHLRESNVFQTLIYLHQEIQFISDPYLLTLGNPIYFKPLSTHIKESNKFHTFIYSHQQIQFISNPYLLVSVYPMYFRPLSITSANPIYFKPSFIHPKESNAPNSNPRLQSLNLNPYI